MIGYNKNYTLAENVTFKLRTSLLEYSEEGAEGYGSDDNNQLNWGGYELKIDSLPVDTSKYTVNWYKVICEDGDDTYGSVCLLLKKLTIVLYNTCTAKSNCQYRRWP